MRIAAVVFLTALSAACQHSAPTYDYSPGRPTIPIPTTLRLSALPGVGSSAKQAAVTATLLDQTGRGIPSTLLTFASSTGRLDPTDVMTTINGDARTTLTSGIPTTVTVSGAGLTSSLSVTMQAPLSVSMSLPRLEKQIPATFSAMVSGDPDPPLRYRWDFGDGQTSSAVAPSHTYADDGRVTITLSVTDGLDRTGTASASVMVRDNPEPPAPPDPGQPPAPTPGLTVTLVASPAAGKWKLTTIILTPTATPINSAGPVLSYDWDLDGDGKFEATSVGPLPVNGLGFLQYPSVGTFTTHVRANSTTVGVTGTAIALVAITN